MATLEAITEVFEEETTFKRSAADLADAAFLARYSNRTFEALSTRLRTYFQWTSDVGLEVFSAFLASRNTASVRHR
jgi:hypothetical protein